MLKPLSSFILRLFGWKTEIGIIPPDRYVLIGAPHTSNWDFPLTLLALSALGIRSNWVAKHTLFRWPLGPIFKAIGGIPVDRSSGAAFMMKVIDLFEEKQKFVLALAPEGTRSRTEYWKTGFYTIAQKAAVPIALGYIDYSKRMVGIGRIVMPSGNIALDFEAIQNFYSDKFGKYKEKQGKIQIQISARKKRKPR